MSKQIVQYEIKEFDPKILEKKRLSGKPPTILFLGKRGSGKSTLIIDILSYMNNIPNFICMSGTEEGNGFYKNYFHPLLLHGAFKIEIVESLLKKQKKTIKFYQENNKKTEGVNEICAGLLLDDCGYDKKSLNKDVMIEIFMNGRHWKICVILSLQYVMSLGPDFRSNFDYVFCLKENIYDNQKKLHKYYFGIFPKFSEFQEVMKNCTSNYECLVLDNTSISTDVKDCVFYYKATPNRVYKTGPPAQWRYLDSIYEKTKNPEDKNEQSSNKQVVVKKVPNKSKS